MTPESLGMDTARARAPEPLLSWAKEVRARHEIEGGARSRLAGLTVVALVGCGRVGSHVADALARLGCGLLLVDPGTVEAASLDSMLAYPVDVGRNKAQVLAKRLQCLAQTAAIPLPIEHPAAIRALRRADIVVSCVADDGARALCAILAAAFAQVHLDLATEARGADLRLMLPGAGCLHCQGGLSRPQEIERMQLPPAPRAARRHAAGPDVLRSLNGIVAHSAVRLVEEWVGGELQGSVSLRLEARLPLRLDITPVAARRPAGSCAVCRLAGQGDAVVAGLPELLKKLVLANQ